MYLINLGMDKNIIDNTGYNLYDRLTLINIDLQSEERIQSFIDWMIKVDIDINSSKIKSDEVKKSNANYVYYQNILRKKNLDNLLRIKEMEQNREVKVKSKI
jgi:hypothetical protein